jgi:hypothetical protein
MRLALTEFITLDGGSQGPGSPTEDTSDGLDHGGWLVPYVDEAFVRRASAWLDFADGLLLGRRTYERSPATGRASPIRATRSPTG